MQSLQVKNGFLNVDIIPVEDIVVGEVEWRQLVVVADLGGKVGGVNPGKRK